MFESDDWDLDQDFLNDVDEKVNNYYSQKDNQESEPKKRKIDINDDSIFSFNHDVSWKESTTNKSTEKSDENKDSRKNLILEIFNKNEFKNAFSDLKNLCDSTSSNTSVNQVQSCKNNQLPRKNLVLGILKNKNIQDKVIENNTKNLELKKAIPKINEKLENTVFNNEKKCQISKTTSKIENRSSNDNFKPPLFENSKKQLLCNVLKQNPIDNIQAKNDITKNYLPIFKPQIESNKKMTLIRKFPGPAGLLPDDIDTNISCISYFNSLEESEMTTKETDSSNLSEYCSQNTKNLFTEGPWQLMLGDLPDNFLKGHDIVTTKQIANMNGFNSTKVEFLAGIIEHIDYSHDNPPIVLKDFTDKIHGIVHKDIPLKYPDLLEPNVVVLLHDVGLLRTSGTFVLNKYQILISPSSLLAIYTSKGTIERTEYMEAIFGNISDGRMKTEGKEKANCISATALEAHPSKGDSQFIEKNNSNNKKPIYFRKNIESVTKKDSSFSTNSSEIDENTDEPMDFDTDVSFSVSFNKITDTQIEKNFNTSMSKNLEHAKEESKKQKSKLSLTKQKDNIQNDDIERAKDLLRSLKRSTPDINEKKFFSRNFKILQTNAEHSTAANTSLKRTESDKLNDMLFEKIGIDKCPEKTVSSACHKEVERSSPFIRSKLLQFKNADTLTLPENSASTATLDSPKIPDKLAEKELLGTSKSMCDISRDTENDSDDEMLSLLDMDIIFSNYSNKN
ncbi:uncharacterized protein LOC117206258 [Bombus bifarius]|uniref:Uncharacterized protein LOC117206258 n=1 Tax=Bombus bifarius TaxID=103933 RepID=A0A6P8LLF4_9HYME|nr:uncharacterized protein LOC117206258 [Bombus bifarius]